MAAKKQPEINPSGGPDPSSPQPIVPVVEFISEDLPFPSKPKRRPAPASIRPAQDSPKPLSSHDKTMDHLGLPFARSTMTTAAGEAALHSRDIPESEIEVFDPAAADRKLVVLAYDRIRLHLLSPSIPLENKARLALQVLTQIQGTKKVVQWDKRVTSQRDLLLKSENLIEQIQKYRGVLPPEKLAELEVQGIDAKIRAAMSSPDDDTEPS